MPAAHERRTANADASPLHLLPPTQMQLRPPTRCCSQSHAPPRRSSLVALHSRPADVLPMQLQARCIHCHRRRCEAAAAARELTAAASGSTSEPARPTQRRVGCIHCHRRRPRMSSLQLQVGRRQSQRDRHRSCSQPRRPTQRHVRRLPLRRVVRRWLPCTRDLRTYCQCRCKPAPLHSLPPTQVRGSCPPHVSSLQLQVGRRQSQRDRRSAV